MLGDRETESPPSIDGEIEEPECRVCRGPAEPGNPLFTPCKCKGSIGYVHQDCLESWLNMKNRRFGGKCELCKAPFRFEPLFAPGTPDQLHFYQVLYTVTKLVWNKFGPMALRVLFCIGLWLIVAPLATVYLYLGWLRRPSAFWGRCTSYTYLEMDWVAGVVILTLIIVSFVGLMSFGDFLRLHVIQQNNPAHPQPRPPANPNNHHQQPPLPREPALPNRPLPTIPEEPGLDPAEASVDETLWLLATADSSSFSSINAVASTTTFRAQRPKTKANRHGNDDGNQDESDEDDDDEDDRTWYPNDELGAVDDDEDDVLDDDFLILPLEEESDNRNNRNEPQPLPPQPQAAPAAAAPVQLPNAEEDGIDFNIALDELLGFRGPVSIVLRNLMVLLLFNSVYLGLFVYLPHSIGAQFGYTALKTSLGLTSVIGNPTNITANASSYLEFFTLSSRIIDSQLGSIALETFTLGLTSTNADPIHITANTSTSVILESDNRKATPANESDRMTTNLPPSMQSWMNWNYLFNYSLKFFNNPGTLINFVMSDKHSSTANATVNTTNEINHDDDINKSNITIITTPINITLGGILRAIQAESYRHDTPFQIRELMKITMGYLVLALLAMTPKIFLVFTQAMLRTLPFRRRRRNDDTNFASADANEEIREGVGNNNERPLNEQVLPGDDHDDDDNVFALIPTLRGPANVVIVVIKVVLLLLLKMCLLPVALGITLDVSTLSVVESSLKSRIAFAGRDLFSFILVHWVAGITFMLIVTVSVLQLREVAHPDLLAQVIRPQEPQPDLLGNLMHERVTTHTKRAAVSIVIYAMLLMVHIYIPAQIFTYLRILDRMPYLRLKLNYFFIMPQLQIPLELLCFHFCMLNILEKNKNSIGELQHHWFKLMEDTFGLSRVLVPRTVAEFRLVGTRPIFSASRTIQSFWVELAKAEKTEQESLIEANLQDFEEVTDSCDSILHLGETKVNGERVLQHSSVYVRLPVRFPCRALRSRSFLLPTKIGRYRLCRDIYSTSTQVFQLWQEVPGDPIPRPPEGWDDLGAGGADVQMRWAWSKEQKSTLERGVAHRDSFYLASDCWKVKAFVICKLLTLAFASWCMTMFVLLSLVVIPLLTGRFLCFIFRVPDAWVHDPFTFAVGCHISLPILHVILKNIASTGHSWTRRLIAWTSSYQTPPVRKCLSIAKTIAVIAADWLVTGIIIDVAFHKSNDWFQGKEEWIDTKSVVFDISAGCTTWLIDVYCNTKLQVDALEEDNPRLLLDLPRLEQRLEQLLAVVNRGEWDKFCAHFSLEYVLSQLRLSTAILVPPLAVLSLSFLKHGNNGTQWWLLLATRRRVITRIIFWICCFVVLFSEELKKMLPKWYQAAHKLARDHRYLVGEVLLNFSEWST